MASSRSRNRSRRVGKRFSRNNPLDSVNIYHIKAAKNIVEGKYGSAAENLFRAAKRNHIAKKGG